MATNKRVGPLRLALLVVLGGCHGGSPVTVLDLAAQRAEQAAITQEWLVYVQADPALTVEQREDRRATAAAQERRISAAEKAAGVTK